MKALRTAALFAALMTAWSVGALDHNLSLIPNENNGILEFAPAIDKDSNNAHSTQPYSTLFYLRSAKASENTDAPIEGYTDWTPLGGKWKYKSLYTGKTYDTQIKICRMLPTEYNPDPHVERYQLTNSLFGTAYMIHYPLEGYVSIYNNYDEESNPIYYHALDDEGNPTETVILSASTYNPSRALCRYQEFMASGKVALGMYYGHLKESGTFDSETAFCSLYDYLYNEDATKDYSFSAEYAKGYYNGESEATINLTKGDGITDIYWAVVKDYRDESLFGDDFAGDKTEYGAAIKNSNIINYINKYRNDGIEDPHLIMGHVSSTSNIFNIPLTWQGIKALAIVAYNGDEATDMIYDFIEVRTPEGWTNYGEVDITNILDWDTSCTFVPDPIKYSSTVPLEYNDATKEYRIVNPFGTKDVYDYIYINSSLGKDKCYIESSYTPITCPVDYKDFDSSEITVIDRFMLNTFMSYNIIKGFLPEILSEKNPSLCFDFTGNIINDYSILAHTKDCLISSESIYINGAGLGTLHLTESAYITFTLNEFSIDIVTGSKITKLDCDFFDSRNPNTKSSFSWDFNSESDHTLNIDLSFYKNVIPPTSDSMSYKAYDEQGNIVKSGILDISSMDLNNLHFATITIEGGSQLLTEGKRRVERSVSESGNPLFTIKNFLNGNFTPVDNNLKIEIIDGQPSFSNIRIDGLSFNVGDSSMESIVIGAPYNPATISGYDIHTDIYAYGVYSKETSEFVGFWTYHPLTITLPEEIFSDIVGIENVMADENDATPIYYNLQGARVETPAKGSVVIEVRGTTSRRIVF